MQDTWHRILSGGNGRRQTPHRGWSRYMVLQPNRKKHMQQNLETVSFKGFSALRRSKVSGASAWRRCIHIGVGPYPVAGSCALGFWLAAVLSCAALQGIWTYSCCCCFGAQGPFWNWYIACHSLLSLSLIVTCESHDRRQ